jgi:hypothetical protein
VGTCLIHGFEMQYDMRSGFCLCPVCEDEELARQALKRKLKRAVRGPKEAKRQVKVAEKAKSFWDV